MTRVYDLVMTHKLDADDLFIHCVQEHCAQRRLNFFLIEPLWVEPFCNQFAKGKVWARTLLNMHSEHHQPEDIYHRLVRLAYDRGTRVIDPPDVAQAAFDKARLHPRLLTDGFQVPFTRIVPADKVGAYSLSESDRAALGIPFVIKPGTGYGRRGVILDAKSEADLPRCVKAWPDANYLLQSRITPLTWSGEPAYFRVFYVFGSIWCCWWNCFTDRYRPLTATDEESFALAPMRDIIDRLAALTGMKFFSSEIAVTEPGRFVLIDYVNDQCHMLSQSANPQMGVPDAVVTAVAKRLVDGVVELIKAAA